MKIRKRGNSTDYTGNQSLFVPETYADRLPESGTDIPASYVMLPELTDSGLQTAVCWSSDETKESPSPSSRTETSRAAYPIL